MKAENKVGSVLILGGGIGGMQAALDLANSGIKVYLLEKGPSIGGVMSQLDKTFPTNDCAMCTISPRLVEVGSHKDIEIITLGEIEEIKGEKGNFEVKIKKYPRYVDEDKCTGCSECVRVCPYTKIDINDASKSVKPIPDEYNMGLKSRGAIYIPYPQAVPLKAVIDPEHCFYILDKKCGICQKKCPSGAIDFNQKERTINLKVGAIILSPGFTPYDPSEKIDLGYKKYRNVITSIEYERILSPSGPFKGEIIRPSDHKVPRKIAFIQCVGSREINYDLCSSVCCMYATKEAIITKEHLGEDVECDIFYMDVRAFGKGYEDYYNRAKEKGVKYIRSRIPKIKEEKKNGNLVIEYIDENGQIREKEYDLVVLSVGIRPPEKIDILSNRLGITLNEFKFCKTELINPISTGKEGIYAAGTFTEPKDIPDTVVQASAAAGEAMSILSEVKGTMTEEKEYPGEKDVSKEEPRIGVFVCHCGTNIASVVNVEEVVEYAKTLKNVVYAENFLYSCSTDSQEKIKERIKEHNLNRVVVAACTPRTHEPLFQNTLKEAGLNPYLFEMTNIREHVSWVHPDDPDKATEKAKDLVRMAVSKARLLEPLENRKLKIKKSALVIGGGISGMSAALTIADQGYDVYLIEKDKELGGNLKKLHYLLDGTDPQDYLKEIIKKVKNHEKIKVYLNSEVVDVDGSIGNFKTKIRTENGEEAIEHGIAIIATGAKEYKPKEYFYGEKENVCTQMELEKFIVEENLFNKNKIENVVMIQCVGSRNEERPYCSKICCSHAIKNALKIKEISPDTNVFILYRDIRTYGYREKYYTEARQKGVIFIRYTEDRRPEVAVENSRVKSVKVFNPDLNMELQIPSDLLVLSAAIIPDIEENEKISKLFKVPLTQDKFFLEAHMKLRPVDFATDGVFLAGLAHYPKETGESIVQSKAAAARASVILSKDYLELDAKISFVVDENCDGCAYCVDICPYDALVLLEYIWKDSIKKTVENNESICKGCGTCMATCPKKGIYVKGFKLEQIEAQIEAVLTGG